jgi:hypothetical protein
MHFGRSRSAFLPNGRVKKRRNCALVLKNNEVPANVISSDQRLSLRCVTFGSVEICQVRWESPAVIGTASSLDGCVQGFF